MATRTAMKRTRFTSRVIIGGTLALVTLGLSPNLATARGISVSTHNCTHGLYGLTWRVVQQHPSYLSVTASQPMQAQIYRGSMRRLPHSQLWLMSLYTFGLAKDRIGDFHPYAIVSWPRVRPSWLILTNAPGLDPGVVSKVMCKS